MMSRQKEKRAWTAISHGVGLLLRSAMVFVLIGVALYGFFRIRAVEIVGNNIYPDDRIRNESGIETGEQLAKALFGNVSARLHDKLPAIESVKLNIVFPDTLVLNITESKAMLAAQTPNGYVHLTAEGRVISGYHSEEGLILLKGLNILEIEDGKQVSLGEEDSGKLKYIAELLTMLEDRGILDKISEIDVSNVAALRFDYDRRLVVRLGGPELLSNKLRFLEDILKKLDNGEAGTLDLTKASEAHFIPG